MTRKEIQTLVQNAEIELEECWSMLADLKYSEVGKDTLKNLIGFQPRLARALYQLETAYLKIRAVEKRLNVNRRKISRKYLTSRLKQLDGYKMIINQVIDIGKSLGDSFAWSFYQHDKQLLKEHLKHEPISRSAVGDGGLGEITFIESAPVFNQCLVIYHGTTTFLRLGDVSMVDVKKFKVVAIGELKSHKLDDATIDFIGCSI